MSSSQAVPKGLFYKYLIGEAELPGLTFNPDTQQVEYTPSTSSECDTCKYAENVLGVKPDRCMCAEIAKSFKMANQ